MALLSNVDKLGDRNVSGNFSNPDSNSGKRTVELRLLFRTLILYPSRLPLETCSGI